MDEESARAEEYDALLEQQRQAHSESLRKQLHFAITIIAELLAVDYQTAGMKLAERMNREQAK